MENVSLLSSVMLICAVVVSLGSGVLAAYGLCVGMFRMFARQTDAARIPQAENSSLKAARN